MSGLRKRQKADRERRILGAASNLFREVGYELARAASLGQRVLCLFRPSSEGSLSAMIAGSAMLTVVEYETVQEASLAVGEFLLPE